jgi:hypothetical protein
METSTNLGLSLPSRDNTVDVADINIISENFRIVDKWAGNFQRDIDEISALIGGAE